MKIQTQKIRIRKKAVVLLSVLFGFISGAGHAGERIKLSIDSLDVNHIVWESRSLLGSIVGTTDRVRGYMVIDPSHLSRDPIVMVEMDLASFDTGIALRNRHMREKYLQTEKYPTARFSGTSLETDPDSLGNSEKMQVAVTGTLSLHGIERSFITIAEITRIHRADAAGVLKPEICLKVQTEFKIKLGDYSIQTPRFLINKMNEEVHIRVQLTLCADKTTENQ